MKYTQWKISLGRLVDENMDRILVPNDFLLPTGNDNREAIANAKLIASAPEMLKALNLLITTIEMQYKKGDKILPPSQVELAYLNAKNIIKQATE